MQIVRGRKWLAAYRSPGKEWKGMTAAIQQSLPRCPDNNKPPISPLPGETEQKAGGNNAQCAPSVGLAPRPRVCLNWSSPKALGFVGYVPRYVHTIAEQVDYCYVHDRNAGILIVG